jgi:RNA polymerase sigma-70 factor (ECF subfamily)
MRKPHQILRVVDDHELVNSVKEGEQGAFRELYQRHARSVAGTVYRLLGRDDEVDDVIQETFLEAYRAMGDLRDPGSVRGWLRTTAVRCTYRKLRRRRRRRRLTKLVQQDAHVEVNSRDEELTATLYTALEQIDPDLRVPWILRHLEERSLAEVADMCEISVATTKRRLAKARDRLRRRLDHE